jgi:hypothetical protein
LRRNDLLHFPTRKKLAQGEDIAFVEYIEIIDQLSSEINYRFQDFDRFQPDITLFNNPLTYDKESQPGRLQLELCELQMLRPSAHSRPLQLTSGSFCNHRVLAIVA